MSGECINNEDLLWFAVRYRLGELSEQERAQFELELGVNQAARETLAEAVELEAAISVCFQKKSSPAENVVSLAGGGGFQWNGFAAAVAVSIVACLALLIPSLATKYGETHSRGEQTWGATPHLRELAFAWSEVGAEMADASFGVDGIPWEISNDAFSSDALTADVAAETLSSAVFVETEELVGNNAAGESGWMLVALSGMQTRAEREALGDASE